MKAAALFSDIVSGNYSLVLLREEDLLSIMKWRNDQIDVLRQKKVLTEADQKNYYTNVVVPSLSNPEPPILLFSYLLNGKCIGYGGLTYIDWVSKRAEVSFLIETERAKDLKKYSEDFTVFLTLLKKFAFEKLGLHRLCTETFDIRPHVIALLEQNGFVFEGRLKEHVLIQGRFVDSVLQGCIYPNNSSTCLGIHSDSYDEKEKQVEPCIECGTVLVSSIAGKVPLLKAVKRAMRKLGLSGKLVGGDVDSHCIGQYFVDQFFPMPKTCDDNVHILLDWCVQNKVRFIIPSRDGELVFWSKHAELFLNQGIRIMVSSQSAVESTLDKLLFFNRCEKLGFPAIKTALDSTAIEASRYVVKERRGAGSIGQGVNVTKEEAVLLSKALKEPIFQPFIHGVEYSIDVYVACDGKAKGAVVRERNVIISGESQVTTTVHDEKLADICMRLAEALGVYGHQVFQVIKDSEGQYHILECNCRFGGASTLAIQAGLDSFYWFFLENSGANIAEYPFIQAKTGLRQIRCKEDIYILT